MVASCRTEREQQNTFCNDKSVAGDDTSTRVHSGARSKELVPVIWVIFFCVKTTTAAEHAISKMSCVVLYLENAESEEGWASVTTL